MRFCRYALRTTDVDAARDFYAAVLGAGRATILALQPQAIARGARPHWLGLIEVDDVEKKMEAFVDRGAMQLGTTASGDAGTTAVLRDPGGAIVGLTTRTTNDTSDVGLHILNTNDLPRCIVAYGELFGWTFPAPVTIGDEALHPFSSGTLAGSFANIAGRADRHPHWLYLFRVPSLANALTEVARGGGNSIVPSTKPGIAVCDDGQGAAFGLAEPGAL